MIEKTIRELVIYAKTHLGLKGLDLVYCENLLLRELHVAAPYEGEVDEKAIAKVIVPDAYLEAIEAHCVSVLGMTNAQAERESAFLMGLLTPPPEAVDAEFKKRYASSPEAATSYLYDLAVASNYYQKTKVDRNIVYDAPFEDGSKLEISINLSKPEKNNKDIAKLVHAKKSGYPACQLCLENLGYEGRDDHPARGNLRLVSLMLNGEKWYLQYSPYGYFEKHCILFHESHTPMEISRRIFAALVAFVDAFPHFFIGSNSDLPIVGGSILNHEHFQGGFHVLPIFHSKEKEEIKLSRHPGVTLHVMDFYDTVLKIEGEDKEKVLDLAEEITLAWRKYEDKSCDIIPSSEGAQHSTVTPLVRKVNGKYQLFLILRNNRCDDRFPGGIFHAHPEYAHIKQEGIGLIEASGLFILPARLKRQAALVEEIARAHTPKEEYLKEHPDLEGFDDMIKALEGGMSARAYMAEVCRKILGNVAVFKNDEKGQEGLARFLRGLNA